MSPPFRFRLRRDVLFHSGALHDLLTGAVHPLTELGRQIARIIDQPRTVVQVQEKLGTSGGYSRASLERELRGLLLCGLVEGACDSIRQRLLCFRRGERMPLRVLEGSRFTCQNSGACCRGYVFGPISAREKARIDALDPRKALPHLDDSPLFIAGGTTRSEVFYQLATRGDTCVFYESGSCGLHRAFGAAAKPVLCQLYPLAAVCTIDGLKVYDRGECANFALSAREGTALADAVPGMRDLFREDLYHPLVVVHHTWKCDYGLILELARRLDHEAQSHTPLLALHAMGHVVRGFVVALTQCPMDFGQPEAAVAAVLARPMREFYPPAASVTKNAKVGLRALAELAAAIAQRVAPGEWLTSLIVPAASLVSEICRHLLGSLPLPEKASHALGVKAAEDTDAILRLSLRQQLFGRDLLLEDQLPAALLRMALVVLLTLAGARLHAINERCSKVEPRHLSAAHMAARRTLHRPEPHALLRANGAQAWPVLDALPALALTLT